MNIHAIIKSAKLGSARKDAQVDTCAVFAAALHDALLAKSIDCQMVVAVNRGLNPWAHSVVEVAGRYYDSMGEFSTDIYRSRAKIHPKVVMDIDYRTDYRNDCYEQEFDGMYDFYIKELNKELNVA